MGFFKLIIIVITGKFLWVLENNRIINVAVVTVPPLPDGLHHTIVSLINFLSSLIENHKYLWT